MVRTSTHSSPRRSSRSHTSERTSPQKDSSERSKKFPKGPTLRSFKRQIDERRQARSAARKEEFLGTPPEWEDLCQVRVVIPSKHRLPMALDNPAAFHQICMAHSIWVTRAGESVLEIHSRSKIGLIEGFDAVNSALHDMRITNSAPLVRYFVQEPVQAKETLTIELKGKSRPILAGQNERSDRNKLAAVDAYSDLMKDIIEPAAQSLMALEKDLKMRVHFGRFMVERIKKGCREFPYTAFSDLLQEYSRRGGANMKTRFADITLAENLVTHLLSEESGICINEADQRRSCVLTVTSQNRELSADIAGLESPQPRLLPPTLTRPEGAGRMEWAMIAPESQVDWSLKVHASRQETEIPGNLKDLMQSVVLKRQADSGNIPRVTLERLNAPGAFVDEVRLKCSTAVPFKHTPYIIEVSTTQSWANGSIDKEAQNSWSIEVYGAHWDEAINCVSGSERNKKDWGPGLKNMWTGRDQTLEQRFKAFLRDMLEIQSILDSFFSRKENKEDKKI